MGVSKIMGVPLYRWMVYFMEIPSKWLIEGYPHFRKPPYIAEMMWVDRSNDSLLRTVGVIEPNPVLLDSWVCFIATFNPNSTCKGLSRGQLQAVSGFQGIFYPWLGFAVYLIPGITFKFGKVEDEAELPAKRVVGDMFDEHFFKDRRWEQEGERTNSMDSLKATQELENALQIMHDNSQLIEKTCVKRRNIRIGMNWSTYV